MDELKNKMPLVILLYGFVIAFGIIQVYRHTETTVSFDVSNSSASVTTSPPMVISDCVVHAVPDFGSAPLSTAIIIEEENSNLIHNKHRFTFGDGGQSGNVTSHTQTHTYQSGNTYTIMAELRDCGFFRCTTVGTCGTTVSALGGSTPTPTPSSTGTASPSPTSTVQPGTCQLTASPASAAPSTNISFAVQENQLNQHNRHFIRYANNQDWVRLDNGDPVSIPPHVYNTAGDYSATFEARSCGLLSCRVIASCVAPVTISSSATPIGVTRDDFDQNCTNCWPGWTPISTPVGQGDARVYEGLGFLYLSGQGLNAWDNDYHTLFNNSPIAPLSLDVAVKFGNAANGGRLNFVDGRYACLSDLNVSSYVTDELYITTLYDTGDSWFGFFVGDYKTINPSYVPGLGTASNAYTNIGFLQKRSGTSPVELVSVQVIPVISRFSLHTIHLVRNSQSITGLLSNIQTGAQWQTSAQIPAEIMNQGGKTGIIYLLDHGSPCTNLPQRETATDYFEVH